jgi:hypothetical protein
LRSKLSDNIYTFKFVRSIVEDSDALRLCLRRAMRQTRRTTLETRERMPEILGKYAGGPETEKRTFKIKPKVAVMSPLEAAVRDGSISH